MDKLQCNSKASSVLSPVEVKGRSMLCDCEQLLQQSQVPYIIAEQGGNSKHHLQTMRVAAVKYAKHNKYSMMMMMMMIFFFFFHAHVVHILYYSYYMCYCVCVHF
jgi:hypothetical protein